MGGNYERLLLFASFFALAARKLLVGLGDYVLTPPPPTPPPPTRTDVHHHQLAMGHNKGTGMDIYFLQCACLQGALGWILLPRHGGLACGLGHGKKKYEWFIRPDMDAFYCLHHIRLEMNRLERKI